MKKKPKPNSKHFWANCPSPNSRLRTKCPECGNMAHQLKQCVYCQAAKKWAEIHGRPFPGTASDGHGRATRQLNTMVGVSN